MKLKLFCQKENIKWHIFSYIPLALLENVDASSIKVFYYILNLC